MSLSLIPDTAPFTSEQRAWLNGFFAGLLHLGVPGETGAAGSLEGTPPAETQPEEEFPWHDPALPLEERLALAQDKPPERQLMAAMAQLDCGACGYVCQTYAEAIARGEEQDLARCVPGGSETAKALKQLVSLPRSAAPAPSPSAAPSKSKVVVEPAWSRRRPYGATLIEARRLTHPEAPKDTRHVVLDLGDSGLTYEPGDALGVLPRNCEQLVERILAALRLTGDELVPTPDGGARRLQEALLCDYHLTRPSRGFLEALATAATNSDEASYLQRQLAAGNDDAWAGLDVLDLLERFPSARLGAVELAASLGKLQPRLYSISSSQRLHPRQVHLTVGVVRYEAHGKWVHGVASNFLGTRSQIGATIPIFVQKSPRFRLPPDPQTPIIMVGPGTGIAPFRAFLQEREAIGARGNSWLFFGNQYFHYDYLYRDEIDRWLAQGVLGRLDIAFSRDSATKVYVQDRMRESGAELWQWLEEGAYFYVCGDAKRMAVDVDQALQSIVATHGRLSPEAAKAYVTQLAKAKRYLKDVY